MYGPRGYHTSDKAHHTQYDRSKSDMEKDIMEETIAQPRAYVNGILWVVVVGLLLAGGVAALGIGAFVMVIV